MTTLLVTLSPALFALLVRPAGKRHKRLRLRERAALPAPRQSSFCGLWALAPRESFPEPHKNTTTGAKARVLAPFPNAALDGPLFHGGAIGIAERAQTDVSSRKKQTSPRTHAVRGRSFAWLRVTRLSG
jgi:hypothetical protein